MLSTDPRWPYPKRSETNRQMARAVEEEREGLVELERAEVSESLMERVKERSEAGKHRAKARNRVTKSEAKMDAGASKAEVVREETMETKRLEAEPEVAKAEMDAGSKAKVMLGEAMEAKWPESSMTEVSAPASKAEVPTPSLAENGH